MEFTTGGRLEVRITAADVGKRVSVRSLTGQEEGGPRFTDTVGVLTSWTDGVLRITRRNGEEVSLPEDTLVAGKTVPAAAARRRGVPAAGAHELQRVAFRGWPPLETERLGEWTLRAARGFTRRANSVLALGDPGVALDTALDRVTDWYAARGLTPYVQVATGAPDADHLLDAELAARGWTDEGRTRVRVGALAPLADRAPDPRVTLHREPDDAWLDAFGHAQDAPREAVTRVLGGGPSVWFATAPGERGEEPAALGRCVVDGRWAGFTAVGPAAGEQDHGPATAVLAELARRALEEGASAGYLQAEKDDPAASALYDRLGFADHHACHYRRAPERSTA